MGMMPGFLFDLDGVLIDSAEFHWEAWLELGKEDKRIQFTRDAFLASLGKRNDLIIKENAPEVSPSEWPAIAKKKEEIFRRLTKDKITLLKGMEPFLKELKEKKVPHIIASSTPKVNLEFFIKITVLGRYFDLYVSADEVKEGKPAPDIFVEAAHRLGYDPKKCIVVEDAPAGIRAGKKAGCFVVGLATTHPEKDLHEADLVYKDATFLKLDTVIAAFEKRLSK